MTTWDDIEKHGIDAFIRTAAPTVNPDASPVKDFNDLFVMVHRSAIRLSPQRFYALCKAKRLMDNASQDICKRLDVLEEVLGYKRDTLMRLLTPPIEDETTDAESESDEVEVLLSDYLRLRTKVRITGDSDRYEDLQEDEYLAHVWYSFNDDEPRWRLDVASINFKIEPDEEGKRKKVIATPQDRWVRVPYHWLYEHPDDTGGDLWVPKRYTAMVKDRKTGQMVEKDVTAKAIRAAATVAACATGDNFKRCQFFGISGLATTAGVKPTEMAQDLGYAEDAELIGVANRKGRNKALRWVRLHPDDRRSPESRDKRSHGPTKAHNAAVMEERRLAREARSALEAQQEIEEAEFESATVEWLRGLPEEQTVHELAYAVGDEPPY